MEKISQNNLSFNRIMEAVDDMTDAELEYIKDALVLKHKERKEKGIQEAKWRVIDAIKAYQANFPDCPFFIEEESEGMDIDIRDLRIDKVVL